MRQLTQHQQTFIINTFFNDYGIDSYPGWRSIAEQLLTTGQCTVAGNQGIWEGGIGNFIKYTSAPNAVDCTLYTFNLDEFLSSEWFKAYALERKIQLQKKQAELLAETTDIAALI